MRQAFNEQSVEEICQHYRGLFDQRRLQAQLLCLPNLRPTTSAPEANVEFHNIVAAVGESQLNAMIPDVMQLLTFYSVCPASTATSAERSQGRSQKFAKGGTKLPSLPFPSPPFPSPTLPSPSLPFPPSP